MNANQYNAELEQAIGQVVDTAIQAGRSLSEVDVSDFQVAIGGLIKLVTTVEREQCAALADQATVENEATYNQLGWGADDFGPKLVSEGARQQSMKLAAAIRSRGDQ